MAHNIKESNATPGTRNAEKPRGDVDANCPPPGTGGAEDFESKVDLPGKTDSGPEPDVFSNDKP